MTGRNKNMVCGALLCAMMLSMTACGNEIPDLTEEESQRVGEYAAVTLLKYDANNRSRLVDPEMVIAKLEKEAAKEASQEEEKAEETGSTGTTEVTMPTAQEDAFLLGCIIGSVIHLIRMKVSGEGHVLAMGPYLSAGVAVAVLWGNEFLQWYLGLYH